jgi:iron complex transport system substrate-binding protein
MTVTLESPRSLRPDVVDDATRREFIAGGLVAGLLVACGDRRRDQASPPTTAAAGPERLTITNRFGTFDVPARPMRVVGIEGRRDFETAIALGLGIVGIGSNAVLEGTTLAPFIEFDISKVTVIQQTEPNLELIASLRPDLILTRASNIERLLAELKAIAPLVPVGGSDYTDPWRPELERIATDLRRQEQLAKVLGAYDREVKAVAERHRQRIASAKVAIVQYSSSGFSSSGTKGFLLPAHTLAGLGGTLLPFLAGLPANEFGSSSFSLEQTGELSGADAILLIANTPALKAEIEANPLWQRLPAVQARRVIVTDARTNYGSVYAATACVRLLDRLYATLP